MNTTHPDAAAELVAKAEAIADAQDDDCDSAYTDLPDTLPEGTILMPASQVPTANPEWRVTGLRGMDTYDGVAFTATVRVGARIVGTLENSGTGGPTTFYGKTTGAQREWAEYVQASKPLIAERMHFLAEEIVADRLIAEYDTLAPLARAAKRGELPFLKPSEDVGAFVSQGIGLGVLRQDGPRAEAYLTATYGAGTRVWRDGAWVSI